MAHLTDHALLKELQRLGNVRYGDRAPAIQVREIVAERTRFAAKIGDQDLEFSVPDDELHSSPICYVSETYLVPLLQRAERMALMLSADVPDSEAEEDPHPNFLTEEDLSAELKRLYDADRVPGDTSYVGVDEAAPERIHYYARIGEETLEFSLTLAEALSAPLDYVRDTYLKPLLAEAAKRKAT